MNIEWSTHMLSGVVAGYAVTGGDWKGAIVGGVFAIVPDLDEPNSKFGKVIYPVSYLINKIFGHRTFFHSILFMVIVGSLITIFDDFSMALAAVSGIFIHIVGDALVGKVYPLYPMKTAVGVKDLEPKAFKRRFILYDRIGRLLMLLLIVGIAYKDFL